MKILSRSTLRQFWERGGCEDSKQPLLAWFKEVEKANWRNPAASSSSNGLGPTRACSKGKAMKMPKLRVIRTRAEHKRALATIEALWDSKPGTKEHDTLEVLAVLVEDYERRAFPLPDADPVEAIRFRLDQLGQEPKDLVPLLGSRSRVSEILNRKRSLTLPMIRALHEALRIPFEALIPASDH